MEPNMGYMDSALTPKEIDFPTTYETFEAQVVVIVQPHKETIYPYTMHEHFSLEGTQRVIKSGKFHMKLIPSGIASGKPTLMITEDEHQ